MSRLALSLALAALASLTPLHRAEAATFAPDMWVYEVVHDYRPATSNFFALATATDGTPVPEGCAQSPLASGLVEVECTTNPGIDLRATVTNVPVQIIGTIAFNRTELVCFNTFSGCPTSPIVLGPDFFFESTTFFDYLTGRLDLTTYNGSTYAAVYRLSPEAVGGEAWFELNEAQGRWDFGLGGSWSVGFDTDYTVTGRLISAPTPVPLPAGLPLLAVGLVAFGLMRRRRG